MGCSYCNIQKEIYNLIWLHFTNHLCDCHWWSPGRSLLCPSEKGIFLIPPNSQLEGSTETKASECPEKNMCCWESHSKLTAAEGIQAPSNTWFLIQAWQSEGLLLTQAAEPAGIWSSVDGSVDGWTPCPGRENWNFALVVSRQAQEVLGPSWLSCFSYEVN